MNPTSKSLSLNLKELVRQIWKHGRKIWESEEKQKGYEDRQGKMKKDKKTEIVKEKRERESKKENTKKIYRRFSFR